jgi:hypothetical protein
MPWLIRWWRFSLGWLLASEPVTLRTLLAAAVILTAVLLGHYRAALGTFASGQTRRPSG